MPTMSEIGAALLQPLQIEILSAAAVKLAQRLGSSSGHNSPLMWPLSFTATCQPAPIGKEVAHKYLVIDNHLKNMLEDKLAGYFRNIDPNCDVPQKKMPAWPSRQLTADTRLPRI